MNDVHFESNRIEVQGALNDKTITFLREAAGELEAAVKRNTKVKTGRTKASWGYIVDEDNGEAHVGSDYENAIWEEFGTGIYALNGDGRQTPWSYQDVDGNWHTTRGKEAREPLRHAMESVQPEIVKQAEKVFKELGD